MRLAMFGLVCLVQPIIHQRYRERLFHHSEPKAYGPGLGQGVVSGACGSGVESPVIDHN